VCSSIKRVVDKAKVYAPYANPQKTRDDATPRTTETARLSNVVLKKEISL
jgi:hypothetical protein